MHNRKTSRRNVISRAFTRSETYLFIILFVLVAVVSIISPRFFTARNALQILRTSAFTGILSIGFLFVLIQGGLDISFTATATVAQYLMALALVSKGNVPILVVLLIPIAVGMLLGSVNAVLIHRLKAPSIIVAIANLNIYYGVLQIISGGTWIYNFPDWFDRVGKGFVFAFVDENGATFGLSYLTLIWIAVAIVAVVVLRYTKLGRHLFALGGNIEAARRSGLSLFRLRLFAYSFLGLLAGLAGIVQALDTQTVAPNALVGREFDVVAAVVLGGANIFGGAGSVGGTLLGVLLITVITNALTLLRIPAYWHQVFIGAVVLASISVTSLRALLARRKERIIDVR
ncbi:ABC transporter permease [Olavius algarvensis spirochete endosymbiont]|uniref:ABC transporter permease n=1 Tax=Olavius algarvensis spirochete endosymbiont TaxID=260710 RepID=UPI0018A86F8C|nr:ABC transporter permease [Olavius algarvensis spirochete endosymbiont]